MAEGLKKMWKVNPTTFDVELVTVLIFGGAIFDGDDISSQPPELRLGATVFADELGALAYAVAHLELSAETIRSKIIALRTRMIVGGHTSG